MKRNFSVRSVLSASLVVAALVVLVSSCKKDLDQGPAIPASGLMVLNLAPDQEGIGVALSGSLINNYPLGFTDFNGNYQNIYAGQREIDVYDYSSDSVISKATFDFKDGELYSLFVTGNNGVYDPLVVKDEVDSTASAEKAYVRFINAVPDSSSPTVVLKVDGNNIYDAPAAFKTVSPFAAVNEGDLVISVGGNDKINASRTIALQNGRVYTALIVGDPNATDSGKKVQIRYIENGIIEK